MIDDIRGGVLERFRVAPVSRFSILLGPVLFDVYSVLFQSAIFILIALPFGFRANILGLLILFAFLAILTMITSTFGNALGLICKSEDKYAPIVHGINLPILLLSGTLLPMSLAPAWLKIIVYFNPIYYVVEASRALVMGNILSMQVLYAFLILVAFVSITFAWATNIYKKSVT